MTASLAPTPAAAGAVAEFVTFRLADQWLGIPVLIVQEVLVAQRIARVPLAPHAIAGFLNLRGQIVTAVDLRQTLGFPARAADTEYMNVVVRHDNELFAFMVDEVGDVVSVADDAVDAPLATLDARWRAVCTGIVRRDRGLLVIASVPDLLKLEQAAA